MTSNDRTDATARIGIWDCAGHLAGWCPLHEASIGEDDEFCRGALNEARAILTTDDPAAVAALAATLAERHPDALLTALHKSGWLIDDGDIDDIQYVSSRYPREVSP